MYAQDYDEQVVYKWWEWHVDLDPYVKNGEVWRCPQSTSPRPFRRAFTNYGMSDGGRMTGEFWTNQNSWPEIYGHYSKNEEFLANFGSFSTAYSGTMHSMAGWDTVADVVMVMESRGASEDTDGNQFSANNAPYLEPGGTNWLQVYDQLSARHSGGQNLLYCDGHVKWARYEWLRTPEGKHAICPPKKTLSDSAGW